MHRKPLTMDALWRCVLFRSSWLPVFSGLALFAPLWFTARRVATPQTVPEFLRSTSTVLRRPPPNQAMERTPGSLALNF
jgi:hypothetical protein